MTFLPRKVNRPSLASMGPFEVDAGLNTVKHRMPWSDLVESVHPEEGIYRAGCNEKIGLTQDRNND